MDKKDILLLADSLITMLVADQLDKGEISKEELIQYEPLLGKIKDAARRQCSNKWEYREGSKLASEEDMLDALRECLEAVG